MIFKICLLSSIAVVVVNSQGCSICGDGKKITAPDAIFIFPGQPSVPCGALEAAGESGAIPLDQCGFLPPFVGLCECAPAPVTPVVPATDAPFFPLTDPPTVPPTDAPVPPTAAPVVPPTDAPVVSATDAPTVPPTDAPTVPPTDAPVVPATDAPVVPATDAPVVPAIDVPVVPATDAPVVPAVPAPVSPAPVEVTPVTTETVEGCSICGDGKKVTAPDAIFEFPGQPSVPCGILETAGKNGQIPLDQCGLILPLIGMCECGTNGVPPTDAPVAIFTIAPIGANNVPESGAPVTNAPVDTSNNLSSDAPVTSFPEETPTDSPVMAPTESPVDASTDSPVESSESIGTLDKSTSGAAGIRLTEYLLTSSFVLVNLVALVI